MNSSQIAQDLKNHHKEDSKFKKNAHVNQVYPTNEYSYLDYSYLLEFDLLRLMGVEMPPIRQFGYYPNRNGYWRDRHLNGFLMPPPPVALPFYHSPNMVSGAQMKRGFWNNKDHPRDERTMKESNHDYYNNLDSGFSSPVPSKHHIMGTNENTVLDNSSEDSCHSFASENGKGTKRLFRSNNKRNGTNNSVYYYHNNQYRHTPDMPDYGKRRLPSGRRSPSEHSHSSLRNQDQRSNNNNCRMSYSQGDLSMNHGNDRHYGRRIFVTGSHHNSNSYYIPPDKFLARAHLIQVTEYPSQLNACGECGKLSLQIYNKFLENQQTSETFRKKITLWRNLFIYIRSHYNKVGLFLVGSTMSGFGSNYSDVDMCLLVRHAHDRVHTEMDQRNEAIGYLGEVSVHLKRSGFVDRVELIQAKVPILKFRGLEYEVDLNCNNAVGIRNTHLLYCYSQMDWRVRPLVLIVKLWASWQDINDAKKMTVSSYSLSLMVIHYLQCGVNPPILPCLHDMYKDKFSPHSDINHIDLHEELAPYMSANKQSLGELLVGFLGYYNQFDYSTYAVSVRLASTILIEECRRARSLKNDPHQWKYLCIEEPFDLTNTARSVYDPVAFERIKKVFCESYKELQKTKSLNSIFGKQFYCGD